jgi:hypothetical protein
VYNVTTPMLLNALYEISFWSNIQYEHTIVITETIPEIPVSIKNKILIKRKEWKKINKQSEELRTSIGNMYYPYPLSEWYDEGWKLTLKSQKINNEFMELLAELAKVINDETVQLLLHHIFEESQYFMRILNTIRRLMSA